MFCVCPCWMVCRRLHMLLALPLSITMMLGRQGGGKTGVCANRWGFLLEWGAIGAHLVPSNGSILHKPCAQPQSIMTMQHLLTCITITVPYSIVCLWGLADTGCCILSQSSRCVCTCDVFCPCHTRATAHCCWCFELCTFGDASGTMEVQAAAGASTREVAAPMN